MAMFRCTSHLLYRSLVRPFSWHNSTKSQTSVIPGLLSQAAVTVAIFLKMTACNGDIAFPSKRASSTDGKDKKIRNEGFTGKLKSRYDN